MSENKDKDKNKKFIEDIESLKNCNKENTDFFDLKGEVHLAKVVDCYDGDTVQCVFFHNGKFQKFRIRMFGYDTPEMRPSKKIPENIRNDIKNKALLAKQRLKELVLDKIVVIECLGFDKYGRLLANIKINEDDSETVNKIMIQEGHGREYFGGSK
jgi:endonuclease YncB( thermonuclease family)